MGGGKEDQSKKEHVEKKTNIFVKGLPETTSNPDLEALFGDIGPLRHAFVVCHPQSRRCKGIGFVRFALESDALKALKQIHNTTFKGQKLTLAWAKPRYLSRLVILQA